MISNAIVAATAATLVALPTLVVVRNIVVVVVHFHVHVGETPLMSVITSLRSRYVHERITNLSQRSLEPYTPITRTHSFARTTRTRTRHRFPGWRG